MRRSFTAIALFVAAATAALPAGGQVAPAARVRAVAAAAQDPPAVETRATLRSITEEEGGRRIYVHLHVVPQARLPFTTLRFRVRERALLAGLREGASVKFRAERIEGENTLVAIRAVPPCARFEPCD